MKTSRKITRYFVNPRRDRQYDAALRDHLEATWNLPGRTHSQIARALGLGNPSKDRTYGQAIMWALADCVETDDTTIAWYPHLRLSAAVLDKKLAQDKYAGHDLKLYKYAPYRKMIDRDPSRTDEVVQGVIRGYLNKFQTDTGNGIYKALVTKMGHVTRPVVNRALKALINDGRLQAEKIAHNNATLYSLLPPPVVSSVVP